MTFKLIFGATIFFSLVACAPKVGDKLTADKVVEAIEVELSDTSKVKQLFQLAPRAQYFAIDKLNQVYLVTDRNEVIKYSTAGKELFRFNNNFLDDLGAVDATDPFNVLLYYPDYLSVLTLDRTMNKTGEFDLSNLNLLQVNAVGSSNDNNVWIYDELAFKLKKINRGGEVLKQSVDMNLQLSYSGKPNFLLERENGVYVNDPDFGILIFNIFGEYESVLEIKGLNRFQIFDNRLIYQRGEKLFAFHLQTFNEVELKIPVNIERGDEVLIQKNRLFIKRQGKISVFGLE